MVDGDTYTFDVGTLVTIRGGGPNGDTPEIEKVLYPNGTQSQIPFKGAYRPPPSPTRSSRLFSSAVAPAPYIVLFSPDAAAKDIQSVNSTLAREAAPNSLSEVVSSRTGLVVFLKAAISPTQAGAIAQEPCVHGVFPDDALEQDDELPSAHDPPSSKSHQYTARGPSAPPKTDSCNPTNIRLQPDPEEELIVLSQPPGARLWELPGYGYASEGGKGVTIYMVDTGANIQNPEWANMPGTKSFIYALGAIHEESDNLGHGSCTASKAAGPLYGAAKNADVVAVKMPRKIVLSAILEALIAISNDVYKKNLRGKAVISMVIGSKVSAWRKRRRNNYKLLLNRIIAEDIVVVAASGNSRESGHDGVNTYPALWATTTDFILVGAVELDGYRSPYSQGTARELTTSAPGFVTCSGGKSTGVIQDFGTSFAAPAVAGVIAVWLSQEEHKARLQVPGQVAANVKKMVKEMSYPRTKGGPAVIWNGIDPRRVT
ncbi:peptidase S8/S53 domain-containing protein [Colletotrichum cereale]|nr:peptidase S8/S53 domain-containing protein [Colletotrichum cereale]